MIAMLAIGAIFALKLVDLSGALPPLQTFPGPLVGLPLPPLKRPIETLRVQVWVSADMGKTWSLWDQLPPRSNGFMYRAAKPGEYWFAVRVKRTDGTLEPPESEPLKPRLRVHVNQGSEPAPAAPDAAPVVTAPPAPAAEAKSQVVQYVARRSLRFPIRYTMDRARIKQSYLYVSRDGGVSWEQAATIAVSQEWAVYEANADGPHLFTIVSEDLNGQREVTDLKEENPDIKLVVDTVPPRVEFTQADRLQGVHESVIVKWKVKDENPYPDRTLVHFRPLGKDEEPWREVSLPIESKYGVMFAPEIDGPITVRVTVFDLAFNKTEAFQDLAGSIGEPVGGPQVVQAQAQTSPTENQRVQVMNLEAELDLLELELIRKQVKRLAEQQDGASSDAFEQIDQLRHRLVELRLRSSPGHPDGDVVPAAVPRAVPVRRPPSPSAPDPLPTIPGAPSPQTPAAPPPRAKDGK